MHQFKQAKVDVFQVITLRITLPKMVIAKTPDR